MQGNPAKKTLSQRGNVLVIIMVAIALLAALTFSATRSTRTQGGGMSQEDALLMANTVLTYATKVENAVNAVMTAGCGIEEVSFETTRYTRAAAFVNPNAPASKKCHIFDPVGGGLEWENCPDASICADPYVADPFVADHIAVQDIGTSATDLVLTIMVREAVCLALNQKANITPTVIPKTHTYQDDPSAYAGTLVAGILIGDAGADPEWATYAGKNYGCTGSLTWGVGVLEPGLPSYMFYYVLAPQ